MVEVYAWQVSSTDGINFRMTDNSL